MFWVHASQPQGTTRHTHLWKFPPLCLSHSLSLSRSLSGIGITTIFCVEQQGRKHVWKRKEKVYDTSCQWRLTFFTCRGCTGHSCIIYTLSHTIRFANSLIWFYFSNLQAFTSTSDTDCEDCVLYTCEAKLLVMFKQWSSRYCDWINKDEQSLYMNV